MAKNETQKSDQHGSALLPFARDDAPLGLADYLRIGLLACTIAPFRMFLFLSPMVAMLITCVLCSLGLREGERLPRWRRVVVAWSGKVYARVVLLGLGFWRIRERRLPGAAPRGCPDIHILVSNHVSYVDILYHMYSEMPSFLAKYETKFVPIIGRIATVMQSVFVQREVSSGRSAATRAIIERCAQTSMPPMLVFPEGTTSNGRILVRFNRGAFMPAVAVQPIILDYRGNDHFSPAWESIPVTKHLLRMLTSTWNSLDVLYLPVYTPSEKERKNPILFANNVQRAMSDAAGMPFTQQTIRDKYKYWTTISRPTPESAHVHPVHAKDS